MCTATKDDMTILYRTVKLKVQLIGLDGKHYDDNQGLKVGSRETNFGSRVSGVGKGSF